jgi:hypothetical protein
MYYSTAISARGSPDEERIFQGGGNPTSWGDDLNLTPEQLTES